MTLAETTGRLSKMKVDSMFGKKKHFNAADRKQKYHHRCGVPVVIISVITGSVLFYIISNGSGAVCTFVKYVSAILAFIAALLSGLQTYFNFNQSAEGHRSIASRYLAAYKTADRIIAYISDGIVKEDEVVRRVECLAEEIKTINCDAEAFPTNAEDYDKAKEGIKAGEEHYTEDELSI